MVKKIKSPILNILDLQFDFLDLRNQFGEARLAAKKTNGVYQIPGAI